ncbi:hypothetical protein [Niabella hirudinis]|uniref:hypothetical protein n=1 Tax=Niabella hirudinis TaxID=1285929 RepID=UPI003EBB697F
MKKACLFFIVVFFWQPAFSQIWKEKLNRVRESAAEKVNRKVNEKINEGVDKGVEAIEDLATGKKTKKRSQERQASGRNEAPDATVTRTEFEGRELLFQTSITTAAGKEKMEHILRETDGVSSVSIDSDTGIVYVTPSSGKDISAAVADTIKKNGYSVKAKNPKK